MTTLVKDKTEYNSLINYLTTSRSNFTTVQGKHSVSIRTSKQKVNFITSIRSNKFFAAFKKVEKDLTIHKIPSVDEDTLEYFTHDIRENIFCNKVYCVDISAAYATALLIKGLISKKTYNYIKLLPKSERLACIGMLAKESVETVYKKGEAVSSDIITNDKRSFFFLTVEEIASVMRCIKMECYHDYIMTWVDCVYLRNNKKVSTIIQMLESFGYNCKAYQIVGLKCNILSNKIDISYYKDGFQTGFSIPKLTILNTNTIQNDKSIRNFVSAQRFKAAVS